MDLSVKQLGQVSLVNCTEGVRVEVDDKWLITIDNNGTIRRHNCDAKALERMGFIIEDGYVKIAI